MAEVFLIGIGKKYLLQMKDFEAIVKAEVEVVGFEAEGVKVIYNQIFPQMGTEEFEMSVDDFQLAIQYELVGPSFSISEESESQETNAENLPKTKFEIKAGKKFWVNPGVAAAIVKGGAHVSYVFDGGDGVTMKMPHNKFLEEILYEIDPDTQLPTSEVGKKVSVKFQDNSIKIGKLYSDKIVFEDEQVIEGELFYHLKNDGFMVIKEI